MIMKNKKNAAEQDQLFRAAAVSSVSGTQVYGIRSWVKNLRLRRASARLLIKRVIYIL